MRLVDYSNSIKGDPVQICNNKYYESFGSFSSLQIIDYSEMRYITSACKCTGTLDTDTI